MCGSIDGVASGVFLVKDCADRSFARSQRDFIIRTCRGRVVCRKWGGKSVIELTNTTRTNHQSESDELRRILDAPIEAGLGIWVCANVGRNGSKSTCSHRYGCNAITFTIPKLPVRVIDLEFAVI